MTTVSATNQRGTARMSQSVQPRYDDDTAGVQPASSMALRRYQYDSDDATIDPESHPIVPDDFVQTMRDECADPDRIEDFDDALAYIERAPSSTDPTTLPRCINCGSICVTTKTAMSKRVNQKDGAKKCMSCNYHANKTLPPLEDVGVDRAAHRTDFHWIHDADDLEDEPAPGFDDDLPDFEHGNRTEAIRRVLLLKQPWDDDDGLTDRETARFIPHSRGFVNYHVRKFRAGEHDDLIVELLQSEGQP